MNCYAYIDGFNLYHGLPRDTKGNRLYRWLNVHALLRAALPSEYEIHSIKYFTAPVKARKFDGANSSDTNKRQRQEIYWRALHTLPNLEIIKGKFLSHNVNMPAAEFTQPQKFYPVIKTEEKGSDVNLSTHLLCDAFDNLFDCAVVISNDSDFALPIETVVTRFQKKVVVITPLLRNRNPARELPQVATVVKVINRSWLRRSKFPVSLTDAEGTFSMPRAWRAS